MHIGSGVYKVAGVDISSIYDDSAYLITYERCHIMIDAGSGAGLDNMLRNIAYVINDLKEIRYLILTHSHHRNSGGAYYMKSLNPDLQIIAHYPDSIYLRKPEKEYNMFIDELKDQKPVPVSLEIWDEIRTLKLCEDDIKILYTPCHTRGSISIAVMRGDLKYIFVGGLLEEMKKETYECERSKEMIFNEDPDILCGSIRCIYGRNNIYEHIWRTHIYEKRDV
ncbi:MAG: MBL fold metallo-hydrolase [Desulfurococcales archaeon]|jgi:glyoxylase-like metal-dependent hydrolase (beta-lactamase superfamily II)|nr:MBL fold metallo-hydrolase [Desulfurococcales archaeon]